MHGNVRIKKNMKHEMNFHGVLKLELKDNEKSEGFVSNFIL